MSSLVDTMKNGVPRTVLRSPAHALMSGRYCLLELTGRVSGRRYRVPVAYVEDGGALLVSTDSAWWRNLDGGRPFAVRLRGRRGTATAERLHGAAAEQALAALVTIPGYARAADVERIGGVVAATELARAARERVVLRITLGGAR